MLACDSKVSANHAAAGQLVLPLTLCFYLTTSLFVFFALCSASALRFWIISLAAVGGVWLGQRQRCCGDSLCVFPAANSSL